MYLACIPTRPETLRSKRILSVSCNEQATASEQLLDTFFDCILNVSCCIPEGSVGYTQDTNPIFAHLGYIRILYPEAECILYVSHMYSTRILRVSAL